MIAITGIEDISGFIQQLDRAVLELDQGISREFERWTKNVVFKQIVTTTPQWTGDLATSWNYSVHQPDETYSPIPNKVESREVWSKADVYQRGAEPAVSAALHKADGVHPSWRDVVYIHNPAPIAEQVENLRVLIRPVNLVDGRVAMVQYYVDKFNRGELGP